MSRNGLGGKERKRKFRVVGAALRTALGYDRAGLVEGLQVVLNGCEGGRGEHGKVGRGQILNHLYVLLREY